MFGWYRESGSAEAMRVRVVVEGRTLSLHTFSERLVACWSLDHLQNREIPLLNETWLVGDRRLPEPTLALDNDRDYGDIQRLSPQLRALTARTWRQLGLSVLEVSNLTGFPFILILLAVPALYWLWQNLPFAHCIAMQPGGILFLKCLIYDHFIR